MACAPMASAPLPPPPPLDDASVAGEEDPGAAVDAGAGGPVLPGVPVAPAPSAPPAGGEDEAR